MTTPKLHVIEAGALREVLARMADATLAVLTGYDIAKAVRLSASPHAKATVKYNQLADALLASLPQPEASEAWAVFSAVGKPRMATVRESREATLRALMSEYGFDESDMGSLGYSVRRVLVVPAPEDETDASQPSTERKDKQ